MPAPAIVVGQEFEWMAVANGDGGMLTMFATVTTAAGRFQFRVVQTGPTAGRYVLMNAAGTAVQTTYPVAPGSRTLITAAQSVAIGAFSAVRYRFQLASAGRP